MRLNLTGFMLIEMMMSLMIGLLIISMLIALYIAANKSYHLQQIILKHLDHAQSAIEILREDIQLDGYMGCTKLPVTQENMQTDHLNIQHIEWPPSTLLKEMVSTSEIVISKQAKLNPGNLAVIADCKHREIFAVAHVFMHADYQRVQTVKPLTQVFEPGAQVSRLVKNNYSVRDTHRHHSDGSPIYALFVYDVHGHWTELVEEIERITVKGGWCKAIDITVNTQPLRRIWHLFACQS